MSSEWREYQLADLSTFKYGKFLAKSQLDDSGYPVYSGYGVVGYLPAYQFEVPQLLIVCRGEGGTGDVKMSPAQCSITNLSIIFAPNEKIVLRKFLYWALKANDTHRLRTGSAQAQIVIGALEKFRLAIPIDLRTQAQIVCTLDALDERISLLRETNATLEAMAQALFKSWFVDFEPVRAKMEGRVPEGMDEDIAALFPDGLEESELGRVPRGWRVLQFKQLCNISSGKRPEERSDTQNSGAPVPLYGGAGIMGFTSRPLFDVPKIVTGRVGTLGKVHIAYPPFWASDNVLVVTPIDEQHFHFCFHWLNSIDVNALNRGSTQPLLTQKDLGSQEHVVSSLPLLELFAAVVGPIYQKTRRNVEQIHTLATLRDTLLPRLISGQLRLSDIEDQISAVAT